MPLNLRVAAPATLASLGVILALVVAGLVDLSGAEAAKQPKCGDTITTDTTLHNDLVNCPNNGILIGADNITLDLNGHLVDGDGTPAAGCDPNAEICDAGVANDGHDGVTVKHGRVREFAIGVLFGTTTAGRVRENRVLGVSSARNQFVGLAIFSSARSLVRNSAGKGSTAPGDGAGLFLGDSRHVRVLDSSFRNNADTGIIVGHSTHNLIKGNLVKRNKVIGIVLEESGSNQVRRNRSVHDGAIGIYIAPGSRNVIARNRISRTDGAEHEGAGIEVDGGDHNVFARNSIHDTKGNAISVGFTAVVGTVVRRNHIRRAGEDGVHVSHKAKRTLLRRNRARHSKDDGFDVNGRTTKLTSNDAVRNHDLGIEAVRGVNDGGGNVARHNGDPRQCTHIACN
jgi:parallel beta-helix repeat protein